MNSHNADILRAHVMDPTQKHQELLLLVHQASAYLKDQKELAEKGELSPCPSDLIDQMKSSIGVGATETAGANEPKPV